MKSVYVAICMVMSAAQMDVVQAASIERVAIGSAAAKRSDAVALKCSESSSIPAPTAADRLSVVLGTVALPLREGLPAPTRSEFDDPTALLFAKSGLIVRSGSKPVELRLISGSELRAKIGWGRRPVLLGTAVIVPQCTARDGRKWLAFSGGYFVAKEQCLRLEVRSNGRARRVSIGVGSPCE